VKTPRKKGRLPSSVVKRTAIGKGISPLRKGYTSYSWRGNGNNFRGGGTCLEKSKLVKGGYEKKKSAIKCLPGDE